MNDSSSTTSQWLANATQKLSKTGIATARLDCLVLLEDATHKDRAWLLAHSEFELDQEVIEILDDQLNRRCTHEPLAYIRGKSEFYGREFIVTSDTLEPRPETETIITLLKSHFPSLKKVQPFTDEKNVNMKILDVGTGSGCIAITTKLEFPALELHATDISEEALAIAGKNAEKLKAQINFYEGSLLQPLIDTEFAFQNTILLANLPYVPNDYPVNEAAMHEPKLALFGGEDGLDLYREMFAQVQNLAVKPRAILTESLPSQHNALEKIAQPTGYKLEETDDFIQLFTLVS